MSQKSPGRLKSWPWVELKRGQDARKGDPEEGREARSEASMCKLPGTRKGLGRIDTRPEARTKATIKLRPAQNFQAGAGSARELPASEPGGGSGLGQGSRKLLGDWGLRPRARLPHSPLRESPRAALCPQAPDHPNSQDRSSSLQLPGIRLLSRPKRAPPRPHQLTGRAALRLGTRVP